MIPAALHQQLLIEIEKIEHPSRRALSARFPFFKEPIIKIRRIAKHYQNISTPQIKNKRAKDYYPYILARHQSVLRRQLGNSDPRLQEAKTVNLQQAIKKLDKLIIPAGQTFSYWHSIGQPSRRKGYVNGMLLADGRVTEGIGGGLCQLSNFLFWILMHCDTEIKERYHHSLDVFPDSGRSLPFGSGATVLYNFIDLQIKNIGQQDLQLKLWLSDKHLKGQVLAKEKSTKRFKLVEKNHYFLKKNHLFYRYNEIWRQEKERGEVKKEELLVKNLAPVLYTVDAKRLLATGQKIIKL